MARPFKSCSVDGCNGDAHALGSARGFCNKHYQRFRKFGDPNRTLINRDQTGQECCIEGCGRPSGYLGMCQAHYRRLKVRGDTSDEALSDRYRRKMKWLEAHVGHVGDGCLRWPFQVSEHGRGIASWGGSQMPAPRVMCIMAHGEPPTPEHHAAHTCGKGHLGCIHPQHLVWKTPAENEADKVEHGTLRWGEAINTAKLKERDVLEMRRLSSVMTRAELSRRFKISPQAVWAVLTRRTWKMLP